MPNTENLSGQRQYELMLHAARKQLVGCDPQDIAAKTGIEYDAQEQRFHLESLGRQVVISWPDCRATAPMDLWHHLTLLQVLAGADGAMPDGEWITLSELPAGGVSRGDSFDRDIRLAIEQRLTPLSADQIEARCVTMGATISSDGRADLCADFLFAQRYPLRLQLWYADDEFPASGKVYVNRGVSHVLGVEAAGTAAVVLIKLLGGMD